MDPMEKIRTRAHKKNRTYTFHMLVREFGFTPTDAISLLRTIDKLRVDLWKEPH